MPYDPLRGMDPSGRIPKPQIPADIEHPERWRYTPPARIKPGNVVERFLVSSFISPIIFSEQDIGFGGGIALTDVDFRDQRYREEGSAEVGPTRVPRWVVVTALVVVVVFVLAIVLRVW